MREIIRLTPADTCRPAPDVRPPIPVGDADRLLTAFKALADASRLAIFRLIAAQDEELCACDIGDRFDLRQPTIAHHLKVLREAGLITAEKRGVWVYYAADPSGLDGVRSLLGAVVPAVSFAGVAD